MKMRRLIAEAAVLLSLSLTLTGCGGETQQAVGGGGNHGSISLPEKIDGKTIKVLGYDGWEQEHGDIRDKLMDWYGATVEYTVVNWRDLENKLSLELVAGNTYDFTVMQHSTMLRDLAMPITQYMDMNDPIFEPTKKIMESFIYNGELYAMASIPHMEVLIYNKTMLENLGYDLPLDLYNRGEWTFDAFKKMVVGLSKEKTEDGEQLEPMSSWDVNAFLVANGTDLVVNKDGKKDFRLNFDDSKVRESLNFFREISFVNKGFVYWQGWSQANFQLGTTAMIMDRFGNKTHFVSDLSFEWDFVPWPKGNSTDENVAPGTVGTFGVPKGSKNPSGGAAYGYLFMKQDFERRKEYLKGYLTEEQVARFESLYPKIGYNWSSVCGINDINQLYYKISTGEDITKVLEELKPTWQSEMDTYQASLKR